MSANVLKIGDFWYAEIHLTNDHSLEQVIYMLGAYETEIQAQQISAAWLAARVGT